MGPVLPFRFAYLFETMTSHGGNEDVNEYTRSVLEWLSSGATHRKIVQVVGIIDQSGFICLLV